MLYHKKKSFHPKVRHFSLLDKAERQKYRPKVKRNRRSGLTMTELLCVIAIIAILSALYLPALARAFLKVKKFLSGQ